MDRKTALRLIGAMGITLVWMNKPVLAQQKNKGDIQLKNNTVKDVGIIIEDQGPTPIDFDLDNISTFNVSFNGDNLSFTAKEVFEALKK